MATDGLPFEEQVKESLSHSYDIERELGGGGMSRVYVATDRSLGRKVVIKVLSPELTESVNRQRFRREIQVAAQLQHPHIVTLLAAGDDGNIVYYTMPFIEGESLRSALERGPQSVRDVIRTLYDVVDALGYAHAHGVIHRDIKPANILKSGNHSLVTDFGVAKALNASMPSSGMTSTGMAIGTPAYMAPEQLAGDPNADHRIDIYAVGLFAYELLSGHSPFIGATPAAVMAALLTLTPKPLSEVRKDVPKRLSEIVNQCLMKDPDDRPPNADAVLVMLDTVATASGEIRTREHRVPTKQIPVVQKQTPQLAPTLAVEAKQPKAAVAEEVYREPTKSRSKILIPVLLALVLISAIGYALTRRGGGDKSAAGAAEQGKAGVASNTAGPVAPPVMTAADSLAIAEAVRKQLAAASAAAAAAAKTKPGQPVVAVNTDSLRKALQQKVTDSVTRVKAAEAQAAAVAAAPAAAPAPAPAPTPAPAGKSRLSIATPATNDQASVNTYSKAFNDALRAALGDKEALSLTDGGESDLVVTPTYVGSGDTVTINISVRDLRKNTAGIRVLHAKVMPAYPQYYVDAVVKAVVKMIDEMAH